MKENKEVCLGCGKSYPIGVMTDTSTMLGDGFISDSAGYFSPDCMKDKEVCCYCGVPKAIGDYTYDEGVDDNLPVCFDCLNDMGFVDEDSSNNWVIERFDLETDGVTVYTVNNKVFMKDEINTECYGAAIQKNIDRALNDAQALIDEWESGI